MTGEIAAMRSGHENILYLLSVLGRQLGAFRRGRTPDMALMRDIVSCLNEYASAAPDGPETALIDRLAERNTRVAPYRVVLMTEHAAISETGARLLRVIDDILDGVMLARSELTVLGSRYVRMFRNHLHRERDYLRRYGTGAAGAVVARCASTRYTAFQVLRERISRARETQRTVSVAERVCSACETG